MFIFNCTNFIKIELHARALKKFLVPKKKKYAQARISNST